jgi:hypothetical protein
MAEREIASVVWYQKDHQIEVTYVEGGFDRLFGSREVAMVLATDAGLRLTTTADDDDKARWAQDL